MLDIEKIEKAYNNSSFFKTLEPNYEIELRHSPGLDLAKTQKSIDNLKNIAKFWSKDYKYDCPIVVVSTDETGRDFLKEQLDLLLFSDAMPSQERFDLNSKGIFGSGGYSIINGQTVLLYWQVVNSKVPFEHTGDFKMGPHLFTHAVQGVLTGEKFSVPEFKSLLTDLPGWYVEGQADFAALMSISNTFEEYLHHRSNYFKYAFVPVTPNDKHDTTRVKLKNRSEEEWANSLKFSPLKFAGIPLFDEYYTGLLAYEEMMFHLDHEEMMVFVERFVKGEKFSDLFKYFIGMTTDNFYDKLGKELKELAKEIHVSSWPSWKQQ